MRFLDLTRTPNRSSGPQNRDQKSIRILGRKKEGPKSRKMSSKSIPKRLPEGQNVAQKCCWISGSILAPILSFFGSQKASQKAPKIAQNRSRRPRAAQRPPGTPPEASRDPFWPHFGTPGSSFSSLSSVLFEACARPTTRSKTLFEITSQRILCDRCGTDAHNTAGSVVGLGPQAHWRSGH